MEKGWVIDESLRTEIIRHLRRRMQFVVMPAAIVVVITGVANPIAGQRVAIAAILVMFAFYAALVRRWTRSLPITPIRLTESDLVHMSAETSPGWMVYLRFVCGAIMITRMRFGILHVFGGSRRADPYHGSRPGSLLLRSVMDDSGLACAEETQGWAALTKNTTPNTANNPAAP